MIYPADARSASSRSRSNPSLIEIGCATPRESSASVWLTVAISGIGMQFDDLKIEVMN